MCLEMKEYTHKHIIWFDKQDGFYILSQTRVYSTLQSTFPRKAPATGVNQSRPSKAKNGARHSLEKVWFRNLTHSIVGRLTMPLPYESFLRNNLDNIFFLKIRP